MTEQRAGRAVPVGSFLFQVGFTPSMEPHAGLGFAALGLGLELGSSIGCLTD